MPSPDPTTPDPCPGQERCPVCWTPFTPNNPANPYPKRYCCGACRIEASRRRRRKDNPVTNTPTADTDEYRYNEPQDHGPCPEHPHCILGRCAQFWCDRTIHIKIGGRGQPRRYCSPACRVAQHRLLN